MKMKDLSEKAIAYIGAQWGLDTSESFDDIKAFWDTGFYELVALRLVNAGAVEPLDATCREIIAVADSIDSKTESELINQSLAEYHHVTCPNCNAVAFHSEYSLDQSHHCYSCNRDHDSKPKPWSKD
jgi:hypothetical protein